MRQSLLAALTLTTLVTGGCGGTEPAAQSPAPAPTSAVVASAAPSTAVDQAPPPPPKPTLAELVPVTLKGIGDAFNAHDAKKIATYFTDDAVVEVPGEPDVHGRDGIARSMQMILDLVGDAKSAPTRVWTKGNVAVVEIVWVGTMTGDFMGVKANKRPLGQTRLHVVFFTDDGLVKEQHEYGDAAGVSAQMRGAKMAPPVPVLPTNPPEVHAAKGTPDEDKLADWAKGIDDAFSKDDVKAVQFADDADYWLNISGQPAARGKKEMTRELTAFFKAFPDQKWTTTNAWGIDGFAIVEHTMSGTQKGPFGPLPASNKPVTAWHWVDIAQPSADGKLQHGWGYANLFEMMAQTGALKMHEGDKMPRTDKAAAPKAPAKDPTKTK
jgi:ketosteroid isomerase-like protein